MKRDELIKNSIDRLFAEPFEPAWMRQKRQTEQTELEQWKKLIKERADLAWRVEAEKSHQRIMANCKGMWRVA